MPPDYDPYHTKIILIYRGQLFGCLCVIVEWINKERAEENSIVRTIHKNQKGSSRLEINELPNFGILLESSIAKDQIIVFIFDMDSSKGN